MKVIKDIDSFIKDNNITHIFIDIDGVIFHSCQAMIDILNERYGGNFDGSDVTSWNFQCCYPNMTSEEIEDTFNDPKFFDIVKPIDGALEFMDKYRDKIILVTKANFENYAHKRKWFDDRGFNIPMIALPLNVSKSLVNMNSIDEYSLFIDDNTQNLIDSNSDFKVQFREYQSNNDKREWVKDWDGMVLYKWK